MERRSDAALLRYAHEVLSMMDKSMCFCGECWKDVEPGEFMPSVCPQEPREMRALYLVLQKRFSV